jgi:amidohydrolase family protein
MAGTAKRSRAEIHGPFNSCCRITARDSGEESSPIAGRRLVASGRRCQIHRQPRFVSVRCRFVPTDAAQLRRGFAKYAATAFYQLRGFADQRELELLVDAGLTPVEAIKIATLNGAQFLKQADHIGSLTVGKQADIVIVKGDPAKHIDDVENVEVVFKDGVGYDSKKLIASVKGQVGIR